MSLTDVMLVGGGAIAAAALLVGIRFGARALYRTRRRGDFGLALARVGREVDGELDLVLGRVDAVRREQLSPVEIVSMLAQTVEMVGRAGATVEGLAAPPDGEALRHAVGQELLRANRALETILEACLVLEGTTRGDRSAGARRSLKWGHLNLIHVRANLAQQSGAAEALSESGRQGWRASRI